MTFSSGRPRPATYRLRTRPGLGKQYKIVIQKRTWFLFWKDWYPVDNAVHSLHHEFIEMYERMDEIIRHELPDATRWVEACYNKLAVGDMRNGKTAPFRDELRPQETEMPDALKRFNELKKLVSEGQGTRSGSRTGYAYMDGIKDHKLLNRESAGAGYDEFIDFKKPQAFDRKPHDPSQQNQGKGQNQQTKKKGEHSWES